MADATQSFDEELATVVNYFRGNDPDGSRTARVLRETLDQLYDGEHTGRYRWDQLHKTEKTHCGTLVEINLLREFCFDEGRNLDYRVQGIDVDCKYSQTLGSWMIPPESLGHLCILLTADDEKATWSLGVVRITADILTSGGNRDAKRTIKAEGRNSIHWIFRNAELPPNVLLQLPRATVDALMALPSGQQRINQIFRIAQKQRIGRGVIATLGQQKDFMKRVRSNGGSRSALRREGIIILGDYNSHRNIAQALGLPIPKEGENVSVRVAPATEEGPGVVRLDGKLWRVANDNDPVVVAPDYPHR